MRGQKQDKADSRQKVQPVGKGPWNRRKMFVWWEHGEWLWKGWGDKRAQIILSLRDGLRNADLIFRAIRSHRKDLQRRDTDKTCFRTTAPENELLGNRVGGAPVVQVTEVWLWPHGGSEGGGRHSGMLRHRLWCVPITVLEPAIPEPSNSKAKFSAIRLGPNLTRIMWQQHQNLNWLEAIYSTFILFNVNVSRQRINVWLQDAAPDLTG